MIDETLSWLPSELPLLVALGYLAFKLAQTVVSAVKAMASWSAAKKSDAKAAEQAELEAALAEGKAKALAKIEAGVAHQIIMESTGPKHENFFYQLVQQQVEGGIRSLPAQCEEEAWLSTDVKGRRVHFMDGLGQRYRCNKTYGHTGPHRGLPDKARCCAQSAEWGNVEAQEPRWDGVPPVGLPMTVSQWASHETFQDLGPKSDEDGTAKMKKLIADYKYGVAKYQLLNAASKQKLLTGIAGGGLSGLGPVLKKPHGAYKKP